MAKIKKGDLVQVITGRTQARGGDRGKQGKVIDVLVEQNRVIVEGINYVTKHVRVGQSQRGTKTGGIETVEAPIHISNVAVVDQTGTGASAGSIFSSILQDGGANTALVSQASALADSTIVQAGRGHTSIVSQ